MSRRLEEKPRIMMTPMIDVVFQLLIFFIVTIKQEDIFSHLDISRPAPDPNQREEQIENLIEILVGHLQTGFSMNGRIMTSDQLEARLRELASYDKKAPVVIKCTGQSLHGKLVTVLDICWEVELRNLSVFSM
ncbi:MAG: biopolymer transporter ExbD [Verrucomicrobiota bacterium]|nr:biopolymer transporter ExbD [Verrucomicrobiota bacterium]